MRGEQWQPREWAEAYVREVVTTLHHSPQFQALAGQLTALGAAPREQLSAGAMPAETQALATLQHAAHQLAEYMKGLYPARQSWLTCLWNRAAGRVPRRFPDPHHVAAASQGANPRLMALYSAQDDVRRWLLGLRAEQERMQALQEALSLAAVTAQEVIELLETCLPDLRLRQPLHAAATEHLLQTARQHSRDLGEATALAQHAALSLAALEQEQLATLQRTEQAAQAAVLAFQLARQAGDMQDLAEALARASGPG